MDFREWIIAAFNMVTILKWKRFFKEIVGSISYCTKKISEYLGHPWIKIHNLVIRIKILNWVFGSSVLKYTLELVHVCS
jgi:hypothetical protein